jgi:Protein of unknown function (DUF3106)
MRTKIIQFAGVIILGASFASLGQSAHTNSGGLHRQPYWYQCVTNGVTLHYLTPVAYFRGLLGMTPTERQRVLADKPEQGQEQVLAKVREYQSMPREVREERLRQTELHWYLLVLLRLDPPERKARLKEISPLDQPMILSQLTLWDQLPADLRHALLEKEIFLRHYVEWQAHSPSAKEDAFGKLPAEQRVRWKQELNRWQALPEGRREELCSAFQRFFLLTEGERKETVQALSDTERRQMELALQSYANLPPAQKRECLESFGKFAAMSAEERNEFLQNAAEWQAMSAYERKTWRLLVNRLPPMPPGFYKSELPPMPPGWVPPPPPRTPPAPLPTSNNTAQASR